MLTVDELNASISHTRQVEGGAFKPKQPVCHFTPMEYCAGDADGMGGFEEWFECKHCSHTVEA